MRLFPADASELTALTALPLPTGFAHAREGGLAVHAVLGTLLVAGRRLALVTDFYRDTQSHTAGMLTAKRKAFDTVSFSSIRGPLTVHTAAEVGWDFCSCVLVNDADTVRTQTHCNKRGSLSEQDSTGQKRV